MLKETLIGKYNENLKIYDYFAMKKIKRENAIEDTDEFIFEKYEEETIILNKEGKEITEELYKNKINGHTKIKDCLWRNEETSLNKSYISHESLPNEIKEDISEEDMKGNVLFIQNYLVSSGSNTLSLSNISVFDEKLNIEFKVNKPIIGTCDLKLYRIYLFVSTKDLEEYNINLNDVIWRFL